MQEDGQPGAPQAWLTPSFPRASPPHSHPALARPHHSNQLEHLEVCGSRIAETWLGEFSVRGILQAKTLEWVAISFSNACIVRKDPRVPHTARRGA